MKIAGPLALALVLAGCASPYAGRNLPQGSPMADVEATMGKPKETIVDSAGYTVWFYPSAPNGRTTWAARFMPDGRLLNLEQRLTKEHPVTFSPRMWILPRVGFSRPSIKLTRVDFPHPEHPTTETNAPSSIIRDNPSP